MKPELRQKLKEVAREVMKEDAEYQQFFRTALEKSGKSIPDMSDEEKKAFFDKVDAAWDGRGEKKEIDEAYGNNQSMAKLVMILKAMKNSTAANQSSDEFVKITSKIAGFTDSDSKRILQQVANDYSKLSDVQKTNFNSHDWMKWLSKYNLEESVDLKKKIKEESDSITEMGHGDVSFEKIMKMYDTGGDFTKKKVSVVVCGKPNCTRDKIVDDLHKAEHVTITKFARQLRVESKINESNGKLVKVGELVDLPPQPAYNSKGGTYKLDSVKERNGNYVYIFKKNGNSYVMGEYQLAAILGKEKPVKEAVGTDEVNKIKEIVTQHVSKGGSLVGLATVLKSNGFKAEFSTSMIPMITIKLKSGKYVLCNKKYADDADFTVGEISGGTL